MNNQLENVSTPTLEIWDTITSKLKEALSIAGYKTFTSSAKPVSFVENVLTLKVPNEFSKEWIKEKCEPDIRTCLLDTEYANMLIDYVIQQEPTVEDDSKQLSIFNTNSTEIGRAHV